MPPRGEPVEAFVHRTSGDVLFVTENDEVAAQHFGAVASTSLGQSPGSPSAASSWT